MTITELIKGHEYFVEPYGLVVAIENPGALLWEEDGDTHEITVWAGRERLVLRDNPDQPKLHFEEPLPY